jgi:hypothetical protein
MAVKTRAQSNERPPKADADAARFKAWLSDFDARHAELAARLDALLHSLGVNPARVTERETA